MRDAAGDLADAFHLLRLPRALVGRAPFGEVARDLRKAEQLAFGVLDRVDDDARPEPASVLADPPSLGFVLAGLPCSRERLLRDACVAWSSGV